MNQPKGITLEFSTKNDKQLLAAEYWCDQITEQMLYGGGKGGGKSYLGVSLIFGDALTYPGTHYFIARQELIDLRKYTIPTIHEVFKNWGLKLEEYAAFNGQDNVYNLYNGSKVFLISCKETPSDPLYERFGSMQMTRGMIEEGGEVVEAAKSNLWLSIGRWKNMEYNLKKKLLITANPKKGWMKREFVDLFNTNTLPKEKKFVKALVTDNKYLPQDYVDTLANERDNVRRQRLYEGDWEYDEDQDSIVSADALEDAFSNTIVKDNEKYMIVDVARFGKDTTTFSFWQGLDLYKIDVRVKSSIQMTIQTAKDFAIVERIPYSQIIIDEDGVGGGVVDGMQGVYGFTANSSPMPTATEIRSKLRKLDNFLVPKTEYKNLKTQCAFKIAELINEHKLSFSVPEYRDQILEELSALLRQKDKDHDGKMAIKPKDKVKEMLGRSPDIGDAIIYRAWFELKKEAILDNPQNERAIVTQKNRFTQNQNAHKINSSK